MSKIKSVMGDIVTDRILFPTDNSVLEYETTKEQLQYKKDDDTYGVFAVGSLNINSKPIINNDRNIANDEKLSHVIGTPNFTIYYGDGQYLENVQTIVNAETVKLLPTYPNSFISDYSPSGNSKMNIDLIQSDLEYPYYNFTLNEDDYGTLYVAQFVTLKLWVKIPDNFTEFLTNAIEVFCVRIQTIQVIII